MVRGFRQIITCNNCALYRQLHQWKRRQDRELISTTNIQATTYGSILTEHDIVHAPDPGSYQSAIRSY